MDDDVITLMAKFKKDLANAEKSQMEAMARRWIRLEESIKDSIELLARQIAERRDIGAPITQGVIFRLQRYQALLGQIQAEMNLYSSYAVAIIADTQEQIATQSLNTARFALEAAAPGVTATFAPLPVSAVENMAGLLGNGSPLHTLLLNNATQAKLIDDMTFALINGTARGINPRKVARQMMDKLAGGLNQALTIARTEQLRVFREAQRQQYQSSGVVEGYFRLATREDRTCPACLARDGEFIPVGEVMPEHPQGRCAQVPKVVGVDAPQWLKGVDWFNQQSSTTQKSILGDARFTAWKNNEFNFEDIAAVRYDGVWGRSLQTVPLKNLSNGGRDGR